VIDYKTSASPPGRADAARSVQLGFYLLAAGADADLASLGEMAAAEFWYPAKKAKSVITRSLDLTLLDEVEDLMQQAADGIAAEDWTPATSHECERCAVRGVCPEWPEGKEAFLG
jgi:RecB family exonuclease